MVTTRIRRLAAVVAVGALMAGGLSGCDIRLDTGSSAPTTISVDEAARQRASWCSTFVTKDLATAVDDDKKDVAQVVDDHQKERVKAFGDFWPDWTGIADAPTLPAYPQVGKDEAGIADVMLWCAEGERLDAAVVDDPDLARLLFSASLGTAHDAHAIYPKLPQSSQTVSASTPLRLDFEKNAYVVDKDAADDDATGDDKVASQRAKKLVRKMDSGRYNLGVLGAQLVIERRIDEGAALVPLLGRLSGEVDALATSTPGIDRDPAYPSIDEGSTNERIATALSWIIDSRIGLVGDASVPQPSHDTWTLLYDCLDDWSTYAKKAVPALPGVTVSAPATVKK